MRPRSAPSHEPAVLPRAAAALVALVGALLVLTGGLQSTVFKPPPTVSARLTGSTQGRPVVATEVGVLGLEGPRVQVQASAQAGHPVFLGIGRAGDVSAYLAQAARLTVDGDDGNGALTTRASGTQPDLPDPGSVDVWVVSRRAASGTVSIDWPDVAGQWVLVAATDGKQAAPAQVSFTWSGRTTQSSAPVLIAVGAVLLVSGLVLFVMLVSRARMERREGDR